MVFITMLIAWFLESLGTASDSMRSRGYAMKCRTAFSIYRVDNRDRSGFMERLETWVKERGGAMIQLDAVNDDMHNHFYGKLGYRDCNTLVFKSKWL